MKSILLSFERRAGRAAALVLLGTTLVAACDDDRPDPVSPSATPTTPSSIANAMSTGALIWRTAANGNQFAFPAGAKFEVVGPKNATWIVADNVAPDLDPAVGKFKIASLASGTYNVCETGAPTDYALATTPCQTAIITGNGIVDVGAFASAHLPYLLTGYQDYAKNPIPGGVFVVQDSLGNPIMGVPDNSVLDRDKTDGKISIVLPGPGKFFLCKIQPPAGWLVPAWVPICEAKTLGNDMSLGAPATVYPPYSVVWSVAAGFVPPNTPLWLPGAKFTITKFDGTLVAKVADNDVNDRHKLDGIFYVKLPGAGTYVICQAAAIPGYHMPKPPCHTVTAEFGKVTWNDYYINPEKQVISQ